MTKATQLSTIVDDLANSSDITKGAAKIGWKGVNLGTISDQVTSSAYGTATDTGTLTGSEIFSLSKGTGFLSTTLTKMSNFVHSIFTSSILGGVGLTRNLTARLLDREVSLSEFYLAGYTDDQAWNTALSYCASNGKDLYVPPKSTPYTWTTAKVWNHHKHGVRCDSSVKIYATGITGSALGVRGLFSETTQTQAAFKNVWEGGEFYGDRVSGNGFMTIGDPTSGSTTYTGGLACFKSVSFHSFDYGITFGNNAFQTHFSACVGYGCNSLVQYPTGLLNSGENLLFLGCQFLNSNIGFDVQSGYFYLVSCSIDYCNQRLIYARTGAQVNMFGGHMESSYDNLPWVATTDSSSYVALRGVTHVITGTSGYVHQNFLYNGGNTDGGVFVEGGSIGLNAGVLYGPTTWGTGQVIVRGLEMKRFGSSAELTNRFSPYRIGASTKQNLLADGGFEDSTSLTWSRADWRFIASNRADVTLDTTNYNTAGSGVSALKIQPGTGRVVGMTSTHECGPGSMPQINGYMKNTIGNATDTLTITARYTDRSGNSAVSNLTGPSISYVVNQANANSSFALFNWSPSTPAPQGTAFVQFVFQTSASVDGTTIHWLDDLNISIYNHSPGGFNYLGRASASFTPGVSGSTTGGAGTYTTASCIGRSEVIGGFVYFSLQVVWTGHTGTGGIVVNGLPHMVATDINPSCNLSINGIPFTGPMVQAVLVAGSQQIVIQQVTAAGVVSSVPLPTSGTLRVSGSYPTT